MRAEQDTQAVFDYMDAHKGRLMLPDQDIISALYGQRILPLDPIRYNMTEKLFSLHRYNGDGMTLVHSSRVQRPPLSQQYSRSRHILL